MTTYSDKYGTFFGRTDENGNIAVLHEADGAAATRLDASVYPIGSNMSARYEHPNGITITAMDATSIGLEIER